MTSACGVIIDNSDNLTRYAMDITREKRANQKGQNQKRFG